MKDEAPRIFRSLEKKADRDGFDTIVHAAVVSYGSLRSPTAIQARDLAKLVLPLWDRISAETKRSLSASLSHCALVPRELVEKLIAAPVEISAPFLLSSPVLSEEDLETLAAADDPRVARLLAGRRLGESTSDQDRSPQVRSGAGKSRPEAAGATTSAHARPRRTVESPPLSPDLLSPAPRPAEPRRGLDQAHVLQALRRLAGTQGGRKEAVPQSRIRDLVALAMKKDDKAFFHELQRALELPRPRLDRLVADRDGEALAVALKALDASQADAMSILMMMTELGTDTRRFDRVSRFYRLLDAAECREMLSGDEPKIRHVPQYSEAPGVRGAAERPRFGRRKTLPFSASKSGSE